MTGSATRGMKMVIMKVQYETFSEIVHIFTGTQAGPGRVLVVEDKGGWKWEESLSEEELGLLLSSCCQLFIIQPPPAVWDLIPLTSSHFLCLSLPFSQREGAVEHSSLCQDWFSFW